MGSWDLRGTVAVVVATLEQYPGFIGGFFGTGSHSVAQADLKFLAAFLA